MTGRVVDPSGGALPGAAVTAINLDTGIRTAVATNAEGHYTIPLLPPGRYSITVDLSGFRSQTRSGLTLDVQQTARFDFTLDWEPWQKPSRCGRLSSKRRRRLWGT